MSGAILEGWPHNDFFKSPAALRYTNRQPWNIILAFSLWGVLIYFSYRTALQTWFPDAYNNCDVSSIVILFVEHLAICRILTTLTLVVTTNDVKYHYCLYHSTMCSFYFDIHMLDHARRNSWRRLKWNIRKGYIFSPKYNTHAIVLWWCCPINCTRESEHLHCISWNDNLVYNFSNQLHWILKVFLKWVSRMLIYKTQLSNVNGS